MNKKILSLILCLSLLMSLFILPVSAAEGDRDNDVPFHELGVSLTGIEVTTLPNDTEYREATDALDLTGGVLTLHYSDDSAVPHPLTAADVVVTGFDNAKVGKQTLKVTYKGFEDEFEVEIVHIYAPATCDKPQICEICKTPNGEPTGNHTYTDACDTTCNVCQAPRQITHKYDNACDTTCNVCKAVRKTTHKYDNACDTTCNVCKAVRKTTHKYTNACDTTCDVCKATRKITHSYAPATCTKAATCKICGAINGNKLGHTYKTTTTKATLKGDGSVVKKCTVCGDEASKTIIKKIKSINLSAIAYTYNGKAKKPSVTVKDSAGKKISSKNYTVSYSSKSPKNVGTYKVTVKFKGNYSGSKTLSFKINPPKTTVKSLTAAKKSLKVAITKKTSQVTGYEVQYATSKSFKSVKTKVVKSAKTTSLTIKSLKAKKTYYVRVRTYKTVSGKKYYSGWSTYKTKKTK